MDLAILIVSEATIALGDLMHRNGRCIKLLALNAVMNATFHLSQQRADRSFADHVMLTIDRKGSDVNNGIMLNNNRNSLVEFIFSAVYGISMLGVLTNGGL